MRLSNTSTLFNSDARHGAIAADGTGLANESDTADAVLAFGDGLRCAGQNAVRIQVTGSDANGNAISTVEVSTNGQAYSNEVSAGDVLNYQYWYRDVAAGGPCGNSHNLTNALQVVWGA